MADKVRVLMVCLGNICRSPLAEVVMRDVAARRGMADRFHFASAGTGDWHVGGGADPRSAATAKRHGLDLSRHSAQRVHRGNVAQWDWLVAMDHDNHANLLRMGANPSRLLMMRQFEGEPVDHHAILPVPDPYYGGPEGFEDAFAMLTDNANRLLDHLERLHSGRA